MSRNYLYTTQRLGIKGLSLDELQGNYPQWFNDLTVCAFNAHGAYPKQKHHLAQFVEGLGLDANKLVWAVYHLADDMHIGNLGLSIFNRIDNNAELGFLFGEKAYWGQGYAGEAAKVMLHHGFNVLNLNRIYCAVASLNTPMLHLAKKLGFVQEGCRRHNLFLQGQYCDEIEFGLLKSEFLLQQAP